MEPKDIMEPTVLQAIMLSDSVIREEGTNKLSLIGCFSKFNAPMFPFRTPMFFITPFVTNMSGSPPEVNITINIEDPTSKFVLASANSKILPPPGDNPPPITKDQIFHIPFPFDGIIIEKQGTYSIQVLVNADEVGSRNFNIDAIST